MSTKALIMQTLATSDMLMDKYLTDLDPKAFFVRPVDGMNHLAWQVGHVISTERHFVEAIKPGSCPPFPEGFDAKHKTTNHASDNPEDFHTKDEYLTLWKAQRAATKNALEGMSEVELDAPCPIEKMRSMTPTVGNLFNLAGLHCLMHAGQFVAVRRKEAMPIVF